MPPRWCAKAPSILRTMSAVSSNSVHTPASPSKNAPVKTREKECGSELRAVAGAVVGRVSGSRYESIHRIAQTVDLDCGRTSYEEGRASWRACKGHA
jgi:hypothetical protein